MKVPLLDLHSQLTPLRDEILEAVTAVIDSTTYIQGPEVVAIEEEVANYCDTAAAVGVSSGTDALLVSLIGLGIGRGDRVLTTPYSFFATMGVILRLGAEPVFADIDPVSYNIDPEKIIEVLDRDTEKTIKAIIPVHLYGQCADMNRILEIAGRYSIPVVEDAAQAIGAQYPTSEGKWQKSGAMGLAGCFSFFPSKNLGGIGDGGMVVSNDTDFAEKIAKLRNHGAYPKYYHAETGGNFRLDPIQATVLRIKLKYLESWHAARRENAELYKTLFAREGFVANRNVTLPHAVYAWDVTDNQNYHIYNQFVIETDKRNSLMQWLHEHDIGCEIYYPLCLHQQKCLKGQIEYVPMLHAEKAADRTLALPIYPELSDPMQEHVVTTIKQFFLQ